MAEILKRKFIRLRGRNQITLPGEILSAMKIHPGDFLEVVLMDDHSIRLKPALLISSVDSVEAREQESLADQDITQGRFKTFDSVNDFLKDVADTREAMDKNRVPSTAPVTTTSK